MSEKWHRKLRKEGYKIEKHKVGRAIWGHTYTRSDGTKFYLSWRWPHQIFRDGEPTNSDAVRKGKAIWAIDYDVLKKLESQGIKVVGVLCRQTGDLWLSTVEAYLTNEIAPPRDYRRRGGAIQRYMPMHKMKHRPGNIKL